MTGTPKYTGFDLETTVRLTRVEESMQHTATSVGELKDLLIAHIKEEEVKFNRILEAMAENRGGRKMLVLWGGWIITLAVSALAAIKSFTPSGGGGG